MHTCTSTTISRNQAILHACSLSSISTSKSVIILRTIEDESRLIHLGQDLDSRGLHMPEPVSSLQPMSFKCPLPFQVSLPKLRENEQNSSRKCSKTWKPAEEHVNPSFITKLTHYQRGSTVLKSCAPGVRPLPSPENQITDPEPWSRWHTEPRRKPSKTRLHASRDQLPQISSAHLSSFFLETSQTSSICVSPLLPWRHIFFLFLGEMSGFRSWRYFQLWKLHERMAPEEQANKVGCDETLGLSLKDLSFWILLASTDPMCFKLMQAILQ